MEHPKRITIHKNPSWDTEKHSMALLRAPLNQMITKMMPKWCPKTAKWPQDGVSRPVKINRFECKPTWNQLSIVCLVNANLLANNVHLLNLFNDFSPADFSNPANPFSFAKSPIVWLQGRPAAGAKPWDTSNLKNNETSVPFFANDHINIFPASTDRDVKSSPETRHLPIWWKRQGG